MRASDVKQSGTYEVMAVGTTVWRIDVVDEIDELPTRVRGSAPRLATPVHGIDVVEIDDEHDGTVFIMSHATAVPGGPGMNHWVSKDAKLPTIPNSGTHKRMTEPAIRDLARELGDLTRQRDPELEVDLEVLDDDDELLDPWFLLTEDEIAKIEDDPTAKIYEVRITGYEDRIWAA